MKRSAIAPFFVPVLFLILASGAAWAMQKSRSLLMDGQVLSTDVQILRGRPYVPLSDVARALHRTVTTKDGAYRLTQATSASRGKGLSGKMAQDLVSGSWILHVVSVEQVAGYSPVYGNTSDRSTVVPTEAGDVLAVVKCRLHNGTKQMQEVAFDKNASGNTALMDDRERGYVPLAFDLRSNRYGAAKMPSGTTLDFVVLFSVPTGANLTNMTYTVGGTGLDRSTDFQVSLLP